MQTAEWLKRPWRFMERCRREFGPTFTVRLLAFSEIVYVSRPDTIKRVMNAPTSTLLTGKARQGMTMLKTMLGTESIMMVDGAPHKRLRKLIAPPLHGERMKAYADVIREETLEELRSWPLGVPVDVQPGMSRITLNVILRCIYGVESKERLETIASLIESVLGLPSVYWHVRSLQSPWIPRNPYGRMLEDMHKLDELIYDMIRERRLGRPEEREDILSLLLTLRDESGAGMTDVEVRDNLWALLTAGHETSANSLAWAIERLLAHPECLERARAEVDAVTEGAPITAAHMPRLEYVGAVIDETLRQRPSPLIALRLVDEPIELEGHLLPKGTLVAACIYLAHHDPDVYPAPEAFRPERFLDQSVPASSYLPFGGGTRRCTGAAFSLYEMKIVLATLLQRLDFSAASRVPAPAQRRTGILTPKGGPSIKIARANL